MVEDTVAKCAKGITPSPVYLLLAILLLKTSVIFGEQDVDLMVNMTIPVVTIKCIVYKPSEEFRLLLFCPIVTPNRDADGMQIDVPCFQDCQPSCQLNEEGICKQKAGQEALQSLKCESERDNLNNLVVSYRVDTSIANTAGRWYCKYRAQSSSTVDLHVTNQTPKPIVLPHSTTTKIPSSSSDANTKATSIIVTSKDIDLVHKSSKSVEEKERRLFNNPYLKFTQTEYMIGGLCIFSISLIINIAFFLRCILAKCYIAYKRKHHSAPGCLAHCLCISTIEVNQSGDSLYEDIEKPGLSNLFFNTSNITTSTSLNENSYERRSQMMFAKSNNSLSSTPVYHSPSSNKYLYMHSTDPRSGEHFVKRVIVYDEVHVPSEVSDSENFDGIVSSKNKSSVQEQRPQRSHSCSPVNLSASIGYNDGASYIIEKRTSASAAPGGPSTQCMFLNGKVAPNRRFSGHVLHRATAEPGIPEEASFFTKNYTEDEEEDDEVVSTLENLNGKEPKTSTRLELSRMMLKKADTLLREANSLLLK